MKRIAIITWITYPNFGTYLQAYALQQYIKSLGYDCKILDDSPYTKTFTNWKNKIFGFLTKKHTAFNINKKKTAQLYSQFKKDYIQIDINSTDKEYLESHYDIFVCGSDQIWNPLFLNDPRSKFYYADFTHKEKIAYAPSLGITTIPDTLKSQFATMISSFKSLSAREPQGKKILTELSNRNVAEVTDPTLLLDSKYWNSLLSLPIRHNEKYLLAYFLSPNPVYIEAAKTFAQTHGLKFKIFYTNESYYQSDGLITAGPIEFIENIRNAEFIFTDSFHGSIFAFLFKIQFITFKRFKSIGSGQNSRVENLLAMMQIPEHLIDENNIKNIYNLPSIDFEQANIHLEPFINSSKQYLQDALINHN